jgi:hypothetical protein
MLPPMVNCPIFWDQNQSMPLVLLVVLLSAGFARYPQRTLTGYWEKILSGEIKVDPVNFAWTIRILSNGSL